MAAVVVLLAACNEHIVSERDRVDSGDSGASGVGGSGGDADAAGLDDAGGVGGSGSDGGLDAGDGGAICGWSVNGSNSDRCGANAHCEGNSHNPYHCVCDSGYWGDGMTCTADEVDINECELNTDNCDANAICTNISTAFGAFTCQCDVGFNGDGVTCIDIDECATNNGDCDTLATCTNHLGADATCRCPDGHSGNGVVCSDFRVNGDGTVTDSRNGLVWQQDVDPNSYNWADAMTYCAGLTLVGGGWRLPTRPELESIVDNQYWPSTDPIAFPNTPADLFWSSTPYTGSSGTAWYVDFYLGDSMPSDTSISYFVRCVR